MNRRDFLKGAGAAAAAGLEIGSEQKLEAQTYARPEQYDQLDKVKIPEKPTLKDIEKAESEISQLCKSEGFKTFMDELRAVISSIASHREGAMKTAAKFIEEAKILSFEALLRELVVKIQSTIPDLQGHNPTDDAKTFQLDADLRKVTYPIMETIASELSRYNKLIHPEQ